MLERLAKGKHSSLLGPLVRCGEKSFMTLGPGDFSTDASVLALVLPGVDFTNIFMIVTYDLTKIS
jgi:hypothetical protein